MKPILQILFILLLSSSSINIPGQLEFTSGLKYTRITQKEFTASYDETRHLFKTNMYSLGLGLSYRLQNKTRLTIKADLSQFKYHVDISGDYYSYSDHGSVGSRTEIYGDFYSKTTNLQLSFGVYIPFVESGAFNFVAEVGYINNLHIRNDSSSGSYYSSQSYWVYPVSGSAPYQASTTVIKDYSPTNDFHKFWSMLVFNPGLEYRTNSDKKVNVSIEAFYAFTTYFTSWRGGGFNLNGFGSRITLLYNLSKDN